MRTLKALTQERTLVVSQAPFLILAITAGLTVLGSVLCEGVPAPFPQGPTESSFSQILTSGSL